MRPLEKRPKLNLGPAKEMPAGNHLVRLAALHTCIKRQPQLIQISLIPLFSLLEVSGIGKDKLYRSSKWTNEGNN